jgi:hypothetical protein
MITNTRHAQQFRTSKSYIINNSLCEISKKPSKGLTSLYYNLLISRLLRNQPSMKVDLNWRFETFFLQ